METFPLDSFLLFSDYATHMQMHIPNYSFEDQESHAKCDPPSLAFLHIALHIHSIFYMCLHNPYARSLHVRI